MKKIMIIFSIFLIMITSMCIQEEIKGTYEVDFYGNQFLFNSNIEEAKNVSVYPDDATLADKLIGYKMVQLQIAYYKNDSEAPYYAKSLVSFSSKYTKLNSIIWSYDLTGKIFPTQLNNTNEYPNATIENPAILLMGPAFCNETKITVKDNVVEVCGTNLEMRQGKYAQYTDFDLAMDKIMLVLMGVNDL